MDAIRLGKALSILLAKLSTQHDSIGSSEEPPHPRLLNPRWPLSVSTVNALLLLNVSYT